MVLRKIIKIEERKILPKRKNLCIENGTMRWVMFTDLRTQSTGLIPEYELNRNYNKMIGVSDEGKQLYMQKISIGNRGNRK